MTEAAFLKEELGPVLAIGIAEVVANKPRDPVEFLGRWLLHYLEEKDRVKENQKRAQAREKEMELWTQARIEREKYSSNVIQREWKSHVSKAAEAKRKEADLAEYFRTISEKADSQYVVEEVQLPEGSNEKPEAEKETELARLRGEVAFKRAQVFLEGLTKENIADMKATGAASPVVVQIIRCVFYLMGRNSPRQLDTWEKIRTLLKPFPFLEWMKGYNPVSPLDKKRKIARVRRLLKAYTDEQVKSAGGGIVVFIVYQWLQGAITFRETRDADIKLRKAAGKDAEEEYEEEEVPEDEEKDAEEEKVRAEEAAEAAAEEATRKATEAEGGNAAADE